MTGSTPVTLDELRWAVTLQGVDFLELYASRRGEDESAHPGVPDTRLDVGATRRGTRIDVVYGADIDTVDARYRVRARGTFTTVEPIEIPGEVMRDFVEQVGVTTLHPFVRAAVRDLSGRLGAAPAVMALLRPGQIRIGLVGVDDPRSTD